MPEQQGEGNPSDPDHLSSEERERIRNLSDEELFEEMLQEADRLHEIDTGGHLTSARFNAIVEEYTLREEKAPIRRLLSRGNTSP